MTRLRAATSAGLFVHRATPRLFLPPLRSTPCASCKAASLARASSRWASRSSGSSFGCSGTSVPEQRCAWCLGTALHAALNTRISPYSCRHLSAITIACNISILGLSLYASGKRWQRCIPAARVPCTCSPADGQPSRMPASSRRLASDGNLHSAWSHFHVSDHPIWLPFAARQGVRVRTGSCSRCMGQPAPHLKLGCRRLSLPPLLRPGWPSSACSPSSWGSGSPGWAHTLPRSLACMTTPRSRRRCEEGAWVVLSRPLAAAAAPHRPTPLLVLLCSKRAPQTRATF